MADIFSTPLIRALEKNHALPNALSLSVAQTPSVASATDAISWRTAYPGVFSALETIGTSVQTASPLTISENLMGMNDVLQHAAVCSIDNILKSYSAVAEAFSSPLMDWLDYCDFSSPLHDILRSIETVIHYPVPNKRFEQICLHALYQAKWFPHIVNLAEASLIFSICDILDTSRGQSKRCEKRIDFAIFSYLTKTRLREVKSGWYHSDLDWPTKKTLCQAMEAFFRGEHALTISCLSTMWEGLIFIKAHGVTMVERQRQRMDKTKADLTFLTQFNDSEEIYSEFFDEFIVSQCDGINDVMDGIPNRHGVAHGWYKKYPNKKAALNAILLTDFLLTLEPCKIA